MSLSPSQGARNWDQSANVNMSECIYLFSCYFHMFSTDTTVNFLCTYSLEYQNDLHTINGNLLHNVDFLDITYQVI